MALARTAARQRQIEGALDELKAMIRARFPDATFVVAHGDDPPGIHLVPTLNFDDIDSVIDVFIKRMVEIQVDDEIPIYVLPTRATNNPTEPSASDSPDVISVGGGDLDYRHVKPVATNATVEASRD